MTLSRTTVTSSSSIFPAYTVRGFDVDRCECQRRSSRYRRTIGSGRGFGPVGSMRKGRARRCFSICVQAWASTFNPRASGNASPVCSMIFSVRGTVAAISFGCEISGHVGDTRVLRVAA